MFRSSASNPIDLFSSSIFRESQMTRRSRSRARTPSPRRRSSYRLRRSSSIAVTLPVASRRLGRLFSTTLEVETPYQAPDHAPDHAPDTSSNTSNTRNGSNTSGRPFPRSWTFEDEIVFLDAMIEQSKDVTITLTVPGVVQVYEHVRNLLSKKDISCMTLASKLRKMKEKFDSVDKRVDKVFAQPHDERVYELCKKLWGKGKGVEVEDGTSVDRGRVEKDPKKRDFPFIRDAIGGNMAAMLQLESISEEKIMVHEENFKKIKNLQLNQLTKFYNFFKKEGPN